MFFVVLATIHATFCLKSSEKKKKHVPKTRFCLVKSNSPELEMGPLGLERSHRDMDLNQSLNSFHLFQPGIYE